MNQFKEHDVRLYFVDRVGEYLSRGGLFNPELANHENVRDLMIDLHAWLFSHKIPQDFLDRQKALSQPRQDT